MDGRILAQSPQSSGGMSEPRRGASANPSNAGGLWGVERARRVRTGGLCPPDTPSASRGDFRTFRRFGFALPHWGEGLGQHNGKKKTKTLLYGGARERQTSRFWAAKKPNRTAAHNSHSAPNSRGAGSPPPASAWSGCLTGRPARPRTGAAGEGGAGDIMALCRRYHLRRGVGAPSAATHFWLHSPPC